MAGVSSIMRLAAQDDPFASYHRVIEERLVSMSEAGGAAPQKALEVPAASGRKIAPAIALADFARKFSRFRWPLSRHSMKYVPSGSAVQS